MKFAQRFLAFPLNHPKTEWRANTAYIRRVGVAAFSGMLRGLELVPLK